MSNHLWGDEDFDWKALDEAINYIDKNSRRWARFGVWLKEKYGTMRVSCTCAYWGEWPIHNFVKPGHVAYRWSRWIFLYVDRPLGKFVTKIGLRSLVNRYQTWAFKKIWRRAAKKWPQVAEEILSEYIWETK